MLAVEIASALDDHLSPPPGFMACSNCLRATTLLEAERRYFNAGRSACCNAKLMPPEPR
jgi:hypothetical protein